MRALIVLFALVATPFVAGVSQVGAKCDNGKSDGHRSAQGTAQAHKGACVPQDPPPTTVLDADHDGVPDSLDSCPNTALGTAVDASGCPVQSAPPPVLDADHDGVPDSLDTCPGTPLGTTVDASGCPVQSTPPPPTSGGCANSGSAGGTASIDGQVYVDASPSYPGLAGWCVQATGPVTATAVSDTYGNYWFPGLPAGTYTVCQTVQAGWHETFPTSGPTCASGPGWTITLKDGDGVGFVWFGNLTP